MKLLKKYQAYEAAELAKRRAKKRKLKVYGSLARGAKKKKKPKLQFDKSAFTEAIGNPYGVKLKKTKSKRRKK